VPEKSANATVEIKKDARPKLIFMFTTSKNINYQIDTVTHLVRERKKIVYVERLPAPYIIDASEKLAKFHKKKREQNHR
jgi:hypothetical protein